MERIEKFVESSWGVSNGFTFFAAFATALIGLYVTRPSRLLEIVRAVPSNPVGVVISTVEILAILIVGAILLNAISREHVEIRRAEIGNVLMPPSPETETDDTGAGARSVAQTAVAVFQALALVVAIGFVGASVGAIVAAYYLAAAKGFEWLAPAMNWLEPAVILFYTITSVLLGISVTWTFWSGIHPFRRVFSSS